MQRYFPNYDGFCAAALDADIVPVYRQLLADRLTPVSAFELLGRDQHAFLLESVVGGERLGRYSCVDTGPRLVYQVYDGNARVSQTGQGTRDFVTKDPLADLQNLLPHRRYHQ